MKVYGEGVFSMNIKHLTRLRFFKKSAAIVALAIAGGLVLAGPANADFDDALKAYSQAKYEDAIDLWQRYAIAGDIQSKQILGDLYSGKELEAEQALALPAKTGVISQNDVTALSWYLLAANHDFSSYNQEPTYREINAKYKAQERIPVLKARMKTLNVKKAEKLVVRTLSAQSEFDLYRLGMMYQAGSGLPKNNVEALKFFELAKGRNRNSNAQASDAAKFLATKMSKKDINIAQERAANWEPPLPEALLNKTPRQVKLEEELDKLRSLQLAQSLANIEKEFTKNEDLLQSSLAALGFYQGGIDGKMGPETRIAIKNFQYSLVKGKKGLTEEKKRDLQTGTLTSEQKVTLIQKAAKREHPQSQYVYGLMFAQGIGVPVNGRSAVKWLKNSAAYGYALSHYALGAYFRDGIAGEDPVGPSVSDATFHFGQALALGHKPAKEALLTLNYDFVPATNDRGSQK